MILDKYYENTKNALPNSILKKFISMNINPQNAIEIGCGAGRDTVYLIKNGWNVLAIDREDTKKIISSRLNEKEKEHFRFEIQNFESIELENNNLIVANYCIPFCDKNIFDEFWQKIIKSILKEGYFVGNFFGVNDEWVSYKKQMIFLEKEQVLKLFENLFEIIFFEEVEKDGTTGMGKKKHWHLYNVIAKKIK